MSKSQRQSRRLTTTKGRDGTVLVQAEHTAMTRTGPLPDAEEMASYQRVSPAIIDFILKAAQDHGAHVRTMEQQMMEAAVADSIERHRRRRRGQYIGGGLAALGILAAAVLAWTGAPTQAVFVLGGLISTIVGILVLERVARSHEPSTEEQSQD